MRFQSRAPCCINHFHVLNVPCSHVNSNTSLVASFIMILDFGRDSSSAASNTRFKMVGSKTSRLLHWLSSWSRSLFPWHCCQRIILHQRQCSRTPMGNSRCCPRKRTSHSHLSRLQVHETLPLPYGQSLLSEPMGVIVPDIQHRRGSVKSQKRVQYCVFAVDLCWPLKS